MAAGYYDVEVIYKAGLSTRVYATSHEEAKAKAISEAEMAGDHLETLAVESTAEWEPQAIFKKANKHNRENNQ